MSTNPVRSLQLAAEYFPFLSYLAELGEPTDLPEIRSLLRKHKPGDPRTPERVVELLEEFGLMERSIDSDLAWDVPHIAAEYFRHLALRQRLAAPGLLAPILGEIARLTEELRLGAVAADADRVKLSSDSIKQVLDAARSLSRENYRAILHEVMRIKSRNDNRTLRERFYFISQLQERHLVNLGTIVDIGGEMECRAVELIGVARVVRESMSNHGNIPDQMGMIASSVRRLKEESWEDFHSALREVTPLFRQIRRDHALAAAVSILLEELRRQGPKALDECTDRLKIARWRADNLLTNFSIGDYLAGVEQRATRPDQLPILTTDNGETSPWVLDTSDVYEQLHAEGGQADLLKWLVLSYGEFPEQQLLQAFQSVADSSRFTATPGPSPESLETTNAWYTYYPLKVSVND